jgi:acyl-coenzyme A thioesterase PaaI-like protein
MGCAVQSMLPAGKAYTTMEFKVNTVRALTDAVPAVCAEGRIVHSGRFIGHCGWATLRGRCEAVDDDLHGV